MITRTLILSTLAVFALIFLTQTGCSDKDKQARLEAALLKQQLNLKEKVYDCKLKILEKECGTDTACQEQKAKDLTECDKLGIDTSGALSTSTVTSQDTRTNTDTGGN